MYQPKEASDIDVAFPANVDKFIPPEEEWKGKKFKLGDKLFTDMFFCGLKNVNLIPREGVDPDRAWRHIRVLSGTFSTKHEHKEAMVAYLMELWFDLENSSWERAKG